ncbi:MAG: conjugal transfer protein TraB [Nitrospirales bacterium]|nr:MAG: conjugal transfer protein TraB [Nitrospirales bacterium]
MDSPVNEPVPQPPLASLTHGLQGEYPDDVQVVSVSEKSIILIGTAHVSQESADLVRAVIEQERPDCVCVELDSRRFEVLAQPKRWESLDLKEIIRKNQLSTLMVNLVLASYQKRLGDQLGVMPGTEMLQATKTAEQYQIPVELCDRDVRITMRRAWRTTPFWRKSLLMSSLLFSVFDTTQVSEKEIRDLKKQDVLSDMMEELGKEVPTLKKVLIDERDLYLAKKIRDAKGERIVAVVGAGHMPGIQRTLKEQQPVNLEELDVIPPVSGAWKWVGWSIPAIIVGSIMYIGFQKGAMAAGENALFWVLANGIPSAVGAVLAFAHPLTIVTAFASAPFTSLTPVIGVGYVTAFVQAYVQPPLVREFQSVAEDIAVPKRWWHSRLLRVFLAFILPTIGSIIGTYVGGAKIVSNIF